MLSITVNPMQSELFFRYGEFLDQAKGELKCDTEIVTHIHDLGRLSSLGDDPVIAYVRAHKRPYLVDKLERHEGTSEIFFPKTGEAIMVFADSLENGLPDLNTIAAFLIKPGNPFISKKGIWHWVPYPIDDDWESFLLVEKDLVENDIEIVNLDDVINIEIKKG